MDPQAMEPFGRALWDYQRGDHSVACDLLRDDGYADRMTVREYFREWPEFSALERQAIDLCRGRVLDVGAGAGCHSLVLQERGIDVLAIDVCQPAINVMAERGVRQVLRIDVLDLTGGDFDTGLLLMHGIGLVQDLRGLDRFLRQAKSLIGLGGQVLVDSFDIRSIQDPIHTAYQETNRRQGRYGGEVRMRFSYRGTAGPAFGWLNVDPETFCDYASRHGWSFQIVDRAPDGDYLAMLTPVA